MKNHSILLCSGLLAILAAIMTACGMSGGSSTPFSPNPAPSANTPITGNLPAVTSSPTNTPTLIITPAITSTPTQTNTPAAFLTGSVTYTGSLNGGAVSPTDPIGVEVYNNTLSADVNLGIAGFAAVTANGGSFNIPLETAGIYCVLVHYNDSGVATPIGYADQAGPRPGEPYALVNGSAGTTGSLPAPPVTVMGGTNNLGTISLNDGNIAGGVAGPITYTGSGTVTIGKEIHVLAFQSGTSLKTRITESVAAKSRGKYHLTLLGDDNVKKFDLVVFYDSVGGAPMTAMPAAMDPVTAFNNVPTTATGPGKPYTLPIRFH